MDKSSTQLQQMPRKQSKSGPKKSTLLFLHQFARVYMPISNMPGITLN